MSQFNRRLIALTIQWHSLTKSSEPQTNRSKRPNYTVIFARKRHNISLTFVRRLTKEILCTVFRYHQTSRGVGVPRPSRYIEMPMGRWVSWPRVYIRASDSELTAGIVLVLMFYTYRTIKSTPIKPTEWRYNSFRSHHARRTRRHKVALFQPGSVSIAQEGLGAASPCAPPAIPREYLYIWHNWKCLIKCWYMFFYIRI